VDKKNGGYDYPCVSSIPEDGFVAVSTASQAADAAGCSVCGADTREAHCDKGNVGKLYLSFDFSNF